MDNLNKPELIFDWNSINEPKFNTPVHKIEIHDETLRDGLQSPFINIPSIDAQLNILEIISTLPINSVTLGFPCVSQAMYNSALICAKEALKRKYSFSSGMTARTVIKDIEPIIDIVDKTGLDIEAQLFIGSSQVRCYVENWNKEDLIKMTKDSINYAKRHNLRVIYITEDTTRSQPAVLKELYLTAAECGVERINICDTVGHATPDGTYELVLWIRNLLNQYGYHKIAIDFHGHMDRGLGVWNSIAALSAGANRIQACALGIGERCGNTPMEQLLLNLKMMGWIEADLTNLYKYAQTVAQAFGIEIPTSLPIVGDSAFLTGTGVHAAAIVKALNNDVRLSELIYSSFPPSWVGQKNEIGIGPMSGKWNMVYWLKKNNLSISEPVINEILLQAKNKNKFLSDGEICKIIDEFTGAYLPSEKLC